jgi:hypothetical protein
MKQLFNKSRGIAWLRKIGWVGFIFFLLKGMIWLTITYVIVR